VPVTLQYSFTVNTNDGSFAYQASAGQSYDNRQYSWSGEGLFDNAAQSYTWSAAGMLGSDARSHTGAAQWLQVPAPSATFEEVPGPFAKEFLNGRLFKNDVLQGNFIGEVTVLPDGKSSGSGTLTGTHGGIFPFDVKDEVPKGAKAPWTLFIGDEPYKYVQFRWEDVLSDGSGVMQGTSTVIITSIPEPATWGLLAAGMAILVLWRAAAGRFAVRRCVGTERRPARPVKQADNREKQPRS